jgi:hypothetical protein
VTEAYNLTVLIMYRVPSGDVNEFLRRLDATLKYLYDPKCEFLMCGDINVNYLNENNQKNWCGDDVCM